jgi:hypothetical protein
MKMKRMKGRLTVGLQADSLPHKHVGELMNRCIGLLVVFGVAATMGWAQSAPVKEAPKVEVPAGAVKAGDGSFHYTDRQGKKWIYRQTPFGMSRAEDRPVEAMAVEVPPGMKATDDGDAVRFERPGPFGTYRWQRKKTDLSDMEQAVWDREKARAAKQD